jgi:hypothetical protein
MRLTRAQRVVLIFYCLLVVCCCVWVPWHFTTPGKSTKVQQGYDWVWSVGCEPPTTAKVDLSAGIEESKPGDPAPEFKVVDAPPASPCHGFKWGEPDIAAIALRLVAATALSAAAFLLAGNWRRRKEPHI